MGSPRILGLIYCAVLASWIGTPGYSQSASGTPAKQGQPPTEQQGSAGGRACLAARQKARSEGWKFSTGPGLSADRGAGPLPECGAGRLGRDSRGDGGLGRDGQGRGSRTGRGRCPRQKNPCSGASPEN